jgi:hypothetical protein
MLEQLLTHCESKLVGYAREELVWFDTMRPSIVSPYSVYEAYYWALSVAGIGPKSAETWMQRNRFREVFTLDNCRQFSADSLIRAVNANPNNLRGRKLRAIHALGRTLSNMSCRQIANKFFGGIIRTRDLSEVNVPALDELPFIGRPSARFMIRNMGGEMIKDDRWLNSFMEYFRCTIRDLERAGKAVDWTLGRVDQILWGYCVQEIRQTTNLAAHFRSLGFGPVESEDDYGLRQAPL